jgi:hypothetical protein
MKFFCRNKIILAISTFPLTEIKIILSTAAWISRYYHTHLQSFELRNVVQYRTGFIT